MVTSHSSTVSVAHQLPKGYHIGTMSKHLNGYEFLKINLDYDKMKKEGSTQREACQKLQEKYGIAAETIRKRLQRLKNQKQCKRKKTKKCNIKGKPILTPVEETALITLLKSAALANHAISRSDVMMYVCTPNIFLNKKMYLKIW